MATWFLSYDGKQVGPFDQAQAVTQARSNPNGFAWKEGFIDWLPIGQVTELIEGTTRGAAMEPPPLGRSIADVIDFKICGDEMQYVEVELDPGESVVAEAGAMMYKSPAITMNAVFGDGSAKTSTGFMDKLVGAGKRLLTGESLFMTIFTHTGQGKAHVAFAAPYPGNIIPLSLANIGGSIICQKDAFLCAAKGVSIGIFFQKKILTGLFGGEGFIMEKLEGDGITFMHAGGTIIERRLADGEVLHVDTGCVVAFQPTVDFSIEQVGNIKTAFFGGEGLFMASLKGPGNVWLQSLPFSRLAGRMLQAVPKTGTSKDEGSVLGLLGRVVQGDRGF